MKEVSDFCKRRALAVYPQLARAVSPKSIGPGRESPLRLGEPPYAVANYFWRDHMSANVSRCANDPTAVVGPIRALGDCLYPLHAEGDLLYFDPTLPAQHGDVVLVQYEFPDTPRSQQNELSFMGKVLVEFADEYWLAWNSGLFPLADIRILGVEVINPQRAAFNQNVSIDRGSRNDVAL